MVEMISVTSMEASWTDLDDAVALTACMAGKTVTPAIDRLIEDGVTLDAFHTFKLCAPSRASTMTGRYPFNVGFYDMPKGPYTLTRIQFSIFN